MISKKESLSPQGEKALKHYHSTIKGMLGETDHGRYVVIDAHTGEWMLGDSVEVVFDMRDSMPDAHPVVIQHPNVSTMRLSSRQTRSFG